MDSVVLHSCSHFIAISSRNCVYIYALDSNLPVPIGDDNALPEDYTEDFGNEEMSLERTAIGRLLTRNP